MGGVFARHYAWVSSMLFLAIMIVGISFVAATSGYISSQQQIALSQNAVKVSEFVAANLLERGQLDSRFRMALNAIAGMMDTHILICDTDGRIVMCSDGLLCVEHIGKMAPYELTQSVLRYGSYTGQSMLDGIYPVKFNLAAYTMEMEQPVGFVIVASPASDGLALTGVFIRIFMLVAGTVLIISFMSAYAVTKRMTNPLKAMARSAQSYAKGDFSTRVPVSDNFHDEINILCHNFNTMADSLQQLEELRQGFIANVSHELRTPMTVISGYVDGILDGAIPAESQPEYLKIIRGEVLRLSRLVARMLDISNMQAANTAYTPKPVNASEQMRQIILGFEKRIESKCLEVEFVLPDDDVTVMFDPDALTQVLTNLTDNAIKFAPEAGLLSISLTCKGHKAFVSVSNSGPQIPQEDIAFIFDRFFKADKSRSHDKGGLGLGLYIVRNIIQNHGESIQVTSENGITTFMFTLTIHSEKSRHV